MNIEWKKDIIMIKGFRSHYLQVTPVLFFRTFFELSQSFIKF